MPVLLDAQAGRKAYICLNPPAAGTSADLSALSAYLTSCVSAGLQADVCLWPLPYQAGLTAAQYKAMIAYYGPTVRASYPLVYHGLAGTGTGGSVATFTSFYPGAAAVDKVGASFFAAAYSAGVTLDSYAAVADADGKPFGLPQIGVDPAQTQAQGTAYLGYVQSFMTGRYSAGKVNGDVIWHDTGTTVMPAASYLEPLWDALYDALTIVPGAPPPPPPPAGKPAVTMYGGAGTFAQMSGATTTPSGHAFAQAEVSGWGFGAGEAAFYTLAAPDGQIVMSTVPLTGNELEPTADHAEMNVFDPARKLFYPVNIPTSTGANKAVTPGQSVGGTDAGAGDLCNVSFGNSPFLRAIASGTTGGGATGFAVPIAAGAKPGDLLLIWAVSGNAAMTWSATGWTAVTAASGTSGSAQLLYRTCDGTEGATVTVTMSASHPWDFITAAVSNVDASLFDPVPSASGQVNASSATISVPGVTTARDGDLELWLGFVQAISGTTPTTITPPAGFGAVTTEAISTGASTSNVGVLAAMAVQAAHGATGAANGTAGAAVVNGGLLLAIPAPAGAQAASEILFTAEGYYFGWDIGVTGLYPAIGYLRKNALTGNWEYDPANSKTTNQLQPTNPAAYAAIGGTVAGLNGSYYATRSYGQADRFPASKNVVIGHYFNAAPGKSGVITVWNQQGGLLASYQIPDMNRQDGATPVTMCPREIKADPSSSAGDERFAVLYDVFNWSGNAQPVPNHVIQEFTYNASTQAIVPKSVPCISGVDDAMPEFCCFDSAGSLYVANSGQNTSGLNALAARNLDVYVKSAGERALVTSAPATTTWATDGRYATPVLPTYSLGYPVAQGLGIMGPLAIDPATSALLGPAWTGRLGIGNIQAGGLGANLLSANQSGFETGTISATTEWAGVVTNISSVTTFALDGTHSMKISSGFAQQIFIASTPVRLAVTPGQEYLLSAWFTKDAAPPNATCQILATWFDAAGNQIGATAAAARSPTSSVSGTFVQALSGTPAPAGAATMQVTLKVSAVSTVTAGQAYYCDRIVVTTQPMRTAPYVDLGITAMRSAYGSMSPGRPSVVGDLLYIPWAVTFSTAELSAYSAATYVPDTAHPQFLQAVQISTVIAGLPGTQPPPPAPPPIPGGGGIFAVTARRDWHFVLGPPTGGATLELAQATGKTVTWRLTEAHDASFTVNATAGYDAGIEPLATDLHVIRGGQYLFRGRIGPSSDELSSGNHLATFTAASHKDILDRRQLYSKNQLKWAATDIASIVWGLVSQTQGEPGGGLGIVQGLGFPLGMTGSKTCQAGDKIAEKIDDLAYVDSATIGAGGFDWDITPHDASALTIDLWPVARGTARGIYLQYGDALTGPGWSRATDTSVFANALIMAGGGTTPPAPAETAAAGIAFAPEGRWDASYNTDENDPVRLAARAILQLDSAQNVIPSWTIPLRPGVWDGPSHIWIGDTVSVFAGSGRLTTVETLRVLELTAAITQDGEQISLTIGAPRPDLRRKLTRIVRQLQWARKHRWFLPPIPAR